MIASSVLMREFTLLVVDPHKSSGVYCSALLQASNHRVYRVSTEQDALARVAGVDGVITEVQGFPLQFAGRLREAAQNPHLAVIALTSYTLMEEYNRILKAGFTACLKKPLRAASFVDDAAEIILPTLAHHPGYAHVQKVLNLFRQTFQEWNEDRVPRLAAALLYYTVFSIAPLLIVVITVANLAFDQAAVTGRLDEQIQGLVGREGADMVQEMIRNAQCPAESTLATVIGVATLLLGAAGVFGQLQDALNTVWGVEPKPGNGILKAIKDRFLSFTMVLGKVYPFVKTAK